MRTYMAFHLSAVLLTALAGCDAIFDGGQMRAWQQRQQEDEANQAKEHDRSIAEFKEMENEQDRKYVLTVSALQTVQVGDTYDEFKDKIAPARRALLYLDGESSTADTQIERYIIMPEDRGATFTVFIRNGHIVDYLAVGFKK